MDIKKNKEAGFYVEPQREEPLKLDKTMYGPSFTKPDEHNRYIGKDTYYGIRHRYCLSETSPLQRFNDIRAIDFLNVYDIISEKDGFAFGEAYTAEEIIGDATWETWSNHMRFRVDACLCELIRRDMIEFSVVSDPYDRDVLYVWDFSLTDLF